MLAVNVREEVHLSVIPVVLNFDAQLVVKRERLRRFLFLEYAIVSNIASAHIARKALICD